MLNILRASLCDTWSVLVQTSESELNYTVQSTYIEWNLPEQCTMQKIQVTGCGLLVVFQSLSFRYQSDCSPSLIYCVKLPVCFLFQKNPPDPSLFMSSTTALSVSRRLSASDLFWTINLPVLGSKHITSLLLGLSMCCLIRSLSPLMVAVILS